MNVNGISAFKANYVKPANMIVNVYDFWHRANRMLSEGLPVPFRLRSDIERVTEHYGTGIRRIKELCDEAGVGVEYRRTPDGTLLVFHRRDAFDGVAQAGVQSHGEGTSETATSVGETINQPSETINETINVPNETIRGSVEADAFTGTDEFTILGFLAVHPHATYEVVSAATGFSRAKVGRIIQSLRVKNMLTRDGSRKAGSWRVTQGGTHA